MKRVVAWGGVLLLAVAAAALHWFVGNFEPVAVRRRDAAGVAARRDPYLALDRFFARMGRPLERRSSAATLASLDQPGTLILDRHRAGGLSSRSEAALWSWVDQGGYLIVVPEQRGEPDTMLEALTFEWVPTPGSEAEPDRRTPSMPSKLSMPETYAVEIPGEPGPLALTALAGFRFGDHEPEWSAGDPAVGAQLAHFTWGDGAVTVVGDFDRRWSNAAVGLHDHAEIVWRLVERYQPTGPIVLVTGLGRATLAGWLADHAGAALVAAILALILWLWRTVPRFGAPLATMPSERRQLHDHLRAVGRFAFRRGGPAAWTPTLRSVVEERMAARLPGSAPRAERIRAVADHIGIAPGDLERALRGEPRDASQFVATVRTLQEVERRL